MKNSLGMIAAGSVVVALILGIFLGWVLKPAPVAEPVIAPETAQPEAAAPKDESAPPPAPADKKWETPAATAKAPDSVKIGDDATGVGAAAAAASEAELAKPASDREKAAYFYGTQIANNLKAQKFDFAPAYVARGLKDALGSAQPLLNEQELADAMAVFQKQMSARQAQQQPKPIDEKTKKEIADFFAANGKLEGVKTTASGLQYKVLKAGDGPSPKDTDSVTVHYRGTFPDGKEFDSSYKRNEPTTFQVKGVIKGWTEALQVMKVGDKFQLWIHPDLGYGGDKIMIFEVELLGINQKAEATPAAQ